MSKLNPEEFRRDVVRVARERGPGVWIEQVARDVDRMSGVLLVLVGLYVGYYGLYELRLATGAKADPEDAVIDHCGRRLQDALAGWVLQHGVLPWVLALVVGALVASGSGTGRAAAGTVSVERNVPLRTRVGPGDCRLDCSSWGVSALTGRGGGCVAAPEVLNPSGEPGRVSNRVAAT